ncbi:MAG: hypothetical protein GTO03_15290 [Planctomycetales bacterium]|nr:hypothetical protein [Planctomycetales bacterium]
MQFEDDQQERAFRRAWEAVRIARPVNYSLFTFGESVLPYFLVCDERQADAPVTVTQGDVRIKRPMIITPRNARPEFQNFFEHPEEEGVAEFLLARSASFSNLKLVNQRGSRRSVPSGMQATVDNLNRKLDEEEEDRVAILTAPAQLAGVAVLRYAAERIWDSAADNIQELRERGFLP